MHGCSVGVDIVYNFEQNSIVSIDDEWLHGAKGSISEAATQSLCCVVGYVMVLLVKERIECRME